MSESFDFSFELLCTIYSLVIVHIEFFTGHGLAYTWNGKDSDSEFYMDIC